MTIGIDARLWGTKHGGIGRYIQELIINLLKIDQNNQYVFFIYNNKDKQEICNECRDIACNVSTTQLQFIQAPYRWYSLSEQLLMARIIKKAKLDLMHFPHFNVPLLYDDHYIATIHDLIIHHFPDERATILPRWMYRLKLIGYKKVIKHAVLKAHAIITPSEFTKKDILRFYNIDEEKIKVIYEGVSDLNLKLKIINYKLNKPACQSSQLAGIAGRNLKLKIKNYLLYVGSAYPHKNLEKLIEAFMLLRQKYHLTNIKLVLVGKIDYFYKQLMQKIKHQFSNLTIGQFNNSSFKQYNDSDIIFYDYANDVDLVQLYQNAKIFITPSLYEGFGLPPIEAMSFGLPVAASQSSSIPEICGNAVLYFNPQNASDIAEKIYQLYNNKDLQAQLRQAGFKQIKKYSWHKMAQEILEVYENGYKNFKNETH